MQKLGRFFELMIYLMELVIIGAVLYYLAVKVF